MHPPGSATAHFTVHANTLTHPHTPIRAHMHPLGGPVAHFTSILDELRHREGLLGVDLTPTGLRFDVCNACVCVCVCVRVCTRAHRPESTHASMSTRICTRTHMHPYLPTHKPTPTPRLTCTIALPRDLRTLVGWRPEKLYRDDGMVCCSTTESGINASAQSLCLRKRLVGRGFAFLSLMRWLPYWPCGQCRVLCRFRLLPYAQSASPRGGLAIGTKSSGYHVRIWSVPKRIRE